MTDKKLFESVPEYLCGLLAGKKLADFESSLASDPQLAREVDLSIDIFKKLENAPRYEASRDLTADILSKIDEEEEDGNIVRFNFRKFIPAAAAAAILIALGLLHLSQDTARPSASPVAAIAENPDESSAYLACRWLAQRQENSGSWDVSRYGGNNSNRIGVAGIALMAFLEQGEDFSGNAQKTAEWLVCQQNTNGLIGADSATSMYNHGIASVALSRAALRFRDKKFEDAVRKSVKFIESSQSDSGGWGYRANKLAAANTSVTAWQIHALHEASNISDSRPSLEKGIAYIRNSLGESGVSYSGTTSGVRGRTLNIAGASCLLLATDAASRKLGEDLLRQSVRKPVTDFSGSGISDPYLTFFLSRAAEISGLDSVAQMIRVPAQALESIQVAIGPEIGSIPSETNVWGNAGGSVYTTAMAAISMRKL